MSLYKADIFRLARHGKQNALPFCFRQKDRVDNRTESPAFRIKRNAAKAITKVLRNSLRNFLMPGRNKSKVVFHPVKVPGMFLKRFFENSA